MKIREIRGKAFLWKLHCLQVLYTTKGDSAPLARCDLDPRAFRIQPRRREDFAFFDLSDRAEGDARSVADIEFLGDDLEF